MKAPSAVPIAAIKNIPSMRGPACLRSPSPTLSKRNTMAREVTGPSIAE